MACSINSKRRKAPKDGWIDERESMRDRHEGREVWVG